MFMSHETAELRGVFKLRNGRTVLDERYHRAPLKISKTFRLDDSGQLSVYMMDASPGMMDGDRYKVEFELEAGTEVNLTNQSFTKVHPSTGRGSYLRQTFRLGKGALLEYFPEPLIPFRGSRLEAETEFELASGAVLLFADIVTPGRTERGEIFRYESLSSRLTVNRCGTRIASDPFRLEPALHRPDISGAFEHYTHMGSFWLFAEQIGDDVLDAIRQQCRDEERVLIGVSRTAEDGVVVRMLGHKVWELQTRINEIRNRVRRLLLGKPSHRDRK